MDNSYGENCHKSHWEKRKIMRNQSFSLHPSLKFKYVSSEKEF